MKSKIYIILAFVALIYCSQAYLFAVKCTRTAPPRDAIHSLVNEIRAYKSKTGALPSDLNFASEEAKQNIVKYKIKLNQKLNQLTSETSDYYEYDAAYLFSFGLIGKPAKVSDFGFDLTVI